MSDAFGGPPEPKRERMTEAQRNKLWDLCGRYNVPFREDDYFIHPKTSFMMAGCVEGWVGGFYHGDKNSSSNDGKPENKKTIYVGVEPNGDSHS